MAPAIDPSELRPLDHLDASSSAFLSPFVLVVWVLLIGIAVFLHLRYRRRAARARAAFDPHAPLEPGEAILLGTVERARGEELAVRVEVTQDGTETESSGSWSHSWTERDRRVRVRPFYLRHASGRRIRVEPPERVHLVDDMDGCIRVNLAERIRTAELTEGEKVFAHGALTPSVDPEQPASGAGYRDAAYGLVLRPLDGKMLLSSRPLGEPYDRRARRHGIAALVSGFLLLGALATQHSYLLRCALGERVEGTIVERKVVESKDDEGGISYAYRLWIAIDGEKRAAVEDVAQSLYRKLETGRRVPLLVVRGWPHVTQLGLRPTIHLAAILAWLILAVPIGIIYSVASHEPIGWWEGPLEEGGSGRLSESA